MRNNLGGWFFVLVGTTVCMFLLIYHPIIYFLIAIPASCVAMLLTNSTTREQKDREDDFREVLDTWLFCPRCRWVKETGDDRSPVDFCPACGQQLKPVERKSP